MKTPDTLNIENQEGYVIIKHMLDGTTTVYDRTFSTTAADCRRRFLMDKELKHIPDRHQCVRAVRNLQMTFT